MPRLLIAGGRLPAVWRVQSEAAIPPAAFGRRPRAISLLNRRPPDMDGAAASTTRMPWWAWAWPALAVVLLAASKLLPLGAGAAVTAALALGLVFTVFASVYHAEVVAHKVGEPFGTLVLAVAVTVIEVALVVSVMLDGGKSEAVLARDTVFAAVMLVCNGVVGLCLLMGGVRHHEQGFQVQGASAALAVLVPLTTLTLILPNFTTSLPEI